MEVRGRVGSDAREIEAGLAPSNREQQREGRSESHPVTARAGPTAHPAFGPHEWRRGRRRCGWSRKPVLDPRCAHGLRPSVPHGGGARNAAREQSLASSHHRFPRPRVPLPPTAPPAPPAHSPHAPGVAGRGASRVEQFWGVRGSCLLRRRGRGRDRCEGWKVRRAGLLEHVADVAERAWRRGRLEPSSTEAPRPRRARGHAPCSSTIRIITDERATTKAERSSIPSAG